MVSKLNSMPVRHKVQDRFHPPASFEHVLAHENAKKQQNRPGSGYSIPSNLNQNPAPMESDITFTKPMDSDTFDYPPSNFDSDGSISSDSSLKVQTFAYNNKIINENYCVIILIIIIIKNNNIVYFFIERNFNGDC